MKNKKLAGMFANESEAVKVIESLKSMGYMDDDISVIAKDSHRLDEIDEETNIDVTNVAVDNTGEVETVLPLGSPQDNSGLMVNYGLFAIPGAEPFTARGPVASTFSDIECDDCLEKIERALVVLGIEKDDAQAYKSYIDRGDILIIVPGKDKSDLERNRVLKYYADNNSLV